MRGAVMIGLAASERERVASGPRADKRIKWIVTRVDTIKWVSKPSRPTPGIDAVFGVDAMAYV